MLSVAVAIAACNSSEKKTTEGNATEQSADANFDSYGAVISADSAIDANTLIDEIVQNGELSKINEKWFGLPLKSLPPMPTF